MENITGVFAANILAAGYNPTTVDEWIISAINYLHDNPTSGGVDVILADGSVNFTGQQTFEAGLITGGPITSSTGLVEIGQHDVMPLSGAHVEVSEPGNYIYLHANYINCGDLDDEANGTKFRVKDDEQKITYIALHHAMNLVDHLDNAAALAAGLVAGDLYHTSGAVMIVT